jgi:glutamate synthase (NADPH/NADH) large chain
MSGGYAFVYKLRPELVNSDAIASDDLRLLPMNDALKAELAGLISNHAEQTGSLLAHRLISNFEEEAKHFVVVMPTDFASVSEIRDSAASRGLDPDGDVVWKQILEATNG